MKKLLAFAMTCAIATSVNASTAIDTTDVSFDNLPTPTAKLGYCAATSARIAAYAEEAGDTTLDAKATQTALGFLMLGLHHSDSPGLPADFTEAGDIAAEKATVLLQNDEFDVVTKQMNKCNQLAQSLIENIE